MYTVTVVETTRHRVFRCQYMLYRARGQFSLSFSSRCQLFSYNRFRLNAKSPFPITELFFFLLSSNCSCRYANTYHYCYYYISKTEKYYNVYTCLFSFNYTIGMPTTRIVRNCPKVYYTD